MVNKQVKRLICACCGSVALALKHWWNRDKGYGCCPDCFVNAVEEDGMEAAIESYGKPGIHHTIPSEGV